MKAFNLFCLKVFNKIANSQGVRILFRVIAIGLAGLHTWAAISSQSMNADGINYLDIGDAYFRGDWANAINPVWPPLYSWVLGLGNLVFQPSMVWEFPAVHIINFVIFLGTLASFEFMWGKLNPITSLPKRDDVITLPNWAWWAIGYLLFIWVSLSLIKIWSVTPDMMMSAFVYLAGGWLAQIRSEDRPNWKTFVYLGTTLGLGYLSKTIMFSVAVIFFAISLLLVRRTWNSIAKPLLSMVIFLILCLPYILLISKHIGKFTLGEAGTVTYTRYVEGIPFPHWQGDPLVGVVLTHPSRVIFPSPLIYEFAEPLGGTYPISTDPSYWYDGIEIEFNLYRQLARLMVSCLHYLEIFFQQQGVFLTCVIALYLLRPQRETQLLQAVKKWALVIPALAAFTLYGLVLVSDRYIGVFVLLFWADILANIRFPKATHHQPWIKRLSMIAILGLCVNIFLFNLEGFNQWKPTTLPEHIEQTDTIAAKPLEVAQVLRQQGINKGEYVAVIGYGFDSFWARLARVKIVAEMLGWEATPFYLGGSEFQSTVLQAFASTGAKAVVAEHVPGYAQLDGWQQVGESNYFIYLLHER